MSVTDVYLSDSDRELRARMRQLAKGRLGELAAEVAEHSEISEELVGLLADAGLFRLVVPAAYGGLHPTVKAIPICIVREELMRICPQADSLFTMQGIAAYGINLLGCEEQRLKYLPDLARGSKLGALALTEPEAGSDVGGIKTSARLSGNQYILNGIKCFITNAPRADVYVTVAKTAAGETEQALSAFVVEKGAAGMQMGKIPELLAPHTLAEVYFDNCTVPATALLGYLGQGFHLAMRTLDMFRGSVGAAAVGLAKAAMNYAICYAEERSQFGRRLSAFQATKFKLADMATQLAAAELLVYQAAYKKDCGAEQVTLEASMAKLFGSEMAARVADEALQIHGGNGLTRRYPIERLYREARGLRIYEGTSEIQRIVIAGQVLAKWREYREID